MPLASACLLAAFAVRIQPAVIALVDQSAAGWRGHDVGVDGAGAGSTTRSVTTAAVVVSHLCARAGARPASVWPLMRCVASRARASVDGTCGVAFRART